MVYNSESLNLKLPHHPLFHILKSFLDVMNEYDASEAEIERLRR